MSLKSRARRTTTDSPTRRPSCLARWPWRSGSDRGSALLEVALTLPLILLVSVAIFEFGRLFQTWEVLGNAAREGARVAILPNTPAGGPEATARSYMQSGQLPSYASAGVSVTTVEIPIGGGATATASRVTINYPFQFIMLQPVARLITPATSLGAAITVSTSAEMRNETQF